ncbi:hypothetical protein [Thiomicrorhabdus sp.]|uniref:hypothetical protein n=1 Tax=Thiomicrorhabdus sp. TaxID=2039724 RepID=UPI002AA72220|nr:hypothetical protein [Thiomicrorhabdus sp.]
MSILLLKATGLWLVIVIAAILNGIFHESVLVPTIGANFALPLSGILLSILVFIITFAFISFFDSTEPKVYIWIGLFWVLLTLSFEFLFGHYVIGNTWLEILQVFNIMKGDLFLLVLFVSAVSPWLAAKVRGMI